MNNLTNKETLTSLELVEQINIFRKEEGNRAELKHKTLLDIIRDEFEEEKDEQKILLISEGVYKDSMNRDKPMFILTLNQSKQILMRESKFVRKHMIAYIEKLENALKETLNPKQNLLLLIIQSATEVERAVALNKYELEYVKPLENKIAVLTHVNKLYTSTEIAKELGMTSAKALNQILAEKKIQYKVNNTWVLTAKYSNLGYESIKQNVLDNGKVVYDRKFTQEGRDFIIDLLGGTIC